MKEIKEVGAQGDALLVRVDRLPPEAVPVKPESGLLIVTHSETGHHHAIAEQPGVEIFQHPTDPLVGWVRMTKEVGAGADVVHRRAWDTHETQRLLFDESRSETIFEIHRQREGSPQGWRQVID